LTIQQAILSGKNFKRPSDKQFYFNASIKKQGLDLPTTHSFADLLSEDWEIEEQTMELTAREIEAAYHYAKDLQVKLNGIVISELDAMLGRLGFK